MKGIPGYVVEASLAGNLQAGHAAGFADQCWGQVQRALMMALDDGYVREIRASKLAEVRVLARATFHFIGMFKEFKP